MGSYGAERRGKLFKAGERFRQALAGREELQVCSCLIGSSLDEAVSLVRCDFQTIFALVEGLPFRRLDRLLFFTFT